jgi:hypothetical protein
MCMVRRLNLCIHRITESTTTFRLCKQSHVSSTTWVFIPKREPSATGLPQFLSKPCLVCNFPLDIGTIPQAADSSAPSQHPGVGPFNLRPSQCTLNMYIIVAFHTNPCSKVSYNRSFWQHFSDTFDIYLKIKRGIQCRIHQVLGRVDSHWHVKHSCPCCQNEVFSLDLSFLVF